MLFAAALVLLCAMVVSGAHLYRGASAGVRAVRRRRPVRAAVLAQALGAAVFGTGAIGSPQILNSDPLPRRA